VKQKKMNQVKIMNNAANNMVLKPPLPLMKNLHTEYVDSQLKTKYLR
jgi:hypothetical protein